MGHGKDAGVQEAAHRWGLRIVGWTLKRPLPTGGPVYDHTWPLFFLLGRGGRGAEIGGRAASDVVPPKTASRNSGANPVAPSAREMTNHEIRDDQRQVVGACTRPAPRSKIS